MVDQGRGAGDLGEPLWTAAHFAGDLGVVLEDLGGQVWIEHGVLALKEHGIQALREHGVQAMRERGVQALIDLPGIQQHEIDTVIACGMVVLINKQTVVHCPAL